VPQLMTKGESIQVRNDADRSRLEILESVRNQHKKDPCLDQGFNMNNHEDALALYSDFHKTGSALVDGAGGGA
jgi:hypothetical protein